MTISKTEIINLAPSDLTFLWEQCSRCFYRKVKTGLRPPSIPIPKVFNKLDASQKAHFGGKPTESLGCGLPAGLLVLGGRWVKSQPITVPGHATQVVLRGYIDTAAAFEDGTFGVIDFKTAEPNPAFVEFYGRQLHSYAIALENSDDPAAGLAPISRLGLICFEPEEMMDLGAGAYAYKTKATWIEVPRNDDAFVAFLGDVLDVVEQDQPPAAAPNCQHCVFKAAPY